VKYLIDTDVLIDALHGTRDTLHTLQTLAVEGVALSLITVAELYEGAFHESTPEQRLAEARQFIRGYTRLDLSDQICEEFGRQRATLRRQGQRIPDMDLLIAATAITHDLTLVTRNTRHFSRIPDLKLYQGT
jgi:tRNA(fMet)-specific endonuclease VapC